MRYDTIALIVKLLNQHMAETTRSYNQLREKMENKYGSEWFEDKMSPADIAVYNILKTRKREAEAALADLKERNW